MSHYFENDDSLPKDRKEISFRFLGAVYTFRTMAGVFSKSDLDYGTRVLLETVFSEGIQGSMLDLGTGFGPVGVLTKLHFPKTRVTMSDVNERACSLAKENALRYRADVTVTVSDGFSGIPDIFDVILLNPPIRAGKQVIYRLFEESRQHLSAEGNLWIVIRKDQGAKSALRELERLFAAAEVIRKDRGYWVIRACNTPLEATEQRA